MKSTKTLDTERLLALTAMNEVELRVYKEAIELGKTLFAQEKSWNLIGRIAYHLQRIANGMDSTVK